MSRIRLFGGARNQHPHARCRSWARVIEGAESDVRQLSDAELRQAVDALRTRRRSGESLDDLLPETFAIVREAAVRTLGERPYEEQLVGGAALHLGSVVDMKAGEGKTLTVTLPACLHALAGDGVHVLTANAYLAARDAEWMGPIYRLLGLTCALLPMEGTRTERRSAYGADVVYGTLSEFAYDYLRDNMVSVPDEAVQRGHFSAIVDEADLVMLDEAAVTAHVTKSADGPCDHADLAALAHRMDRSDHYTVDEVRRTVSLTELGMAVVEAWFGSEVYNGAGAGVAQRMACAVQAKELYVKGRDYVVVEGVIRIVDRTTQRVVTDRTFGGGLDQALDAKEGLEVRPERRTVAVIDGHAYLGLYDRLAGMAAVVVEDDADAYRDLYGLECLTVAPRRPGRRVDHDPVVYPDDRALLRATAETTDKQRTSGRPVLVGTASAESAQRISRALTAKGIDHQVLSAANDVLEAEIFTRAGRPGAVTVLTRPAGRGVGVRLADPEGAGLYVLGVGPLPSRRLEFQLRDRAGRGGDPGESALFFSLEDPSMGFSNVLVRAVDAAGVDDPIQGRLITRSVVAKLDALAGYEIQKLVAALSCSAIREAQRAAVYTKRDDILRNSLSPEETNRLIEKLMRQFVLSARTGPADVDKLSKVLRVYYPTTVDSEALAKGLSGNPSSKTRADLAAAVAGDALAASARQEEALGPEASATAKRRIMLAVIDRLWRDQLRDLDAAHSAATLRTAAGGDALAIYRQMAADLVTRMWEEINEQFVGHWFHAGRSES